MSADIAVTQEMLSRVRPPQYEQPNVPASAFSRWFIVAAALDNHGWRLAGAFDPQDISTTASAAANRRNWEIMSLSVQFGRRVVQHERQLREAASACSTGEMPACTEDGPEEVRDSITIQADAEQARAEIAQFESTPRPELGPDQQLIAAAALACHAAFDGPTRVDAADVLFTDLSHVSGEAINVLAAMQPVGVQ